MSALAEALVAAQARAIAAIGKGYIAAPEVNEDAAVLETLDAIGCGDKIEQSQLLAAWRVLRAAGTPPVPEQKPSQNGPDRSKATDAQLGLMRKLAYERNYDLPDDPQLLTRDQASQVINLMKAGEYDRAAWAVPF